MMAPCLACHQGCAQTEDTVGVSALLCLSQSGVNCPKFLIHRKISQTWVWQPKAEAALYGRLNSVLYNSQRLTAVSKEAIETTGA